MRSKPKQWKNLPHEALVNLCEEVEANNCRLALVPTLNSNKTLFDNLTVGDKRDGQAAIQLKRRVSRRKRQKEVSEEKWAAMMF